MSELLPELETLPPRLATRPRGEGRVFRNPRSRFWHMAYCVDGREYRESTREVDETAARAALDRRLADMRPSPGIRPVRIASFAWIIRSIEVEAEDLTHESRVYCVRAGDAPYIKIGTAHTPESRVASLQTGSPTPLILLFVLPGGKPLERHLHQALGRWRLQGEWFSLRQEALTAVFRAIRAWKAAGA